MKTDEQSGFLWEIGNDLLEQSDLRNSRVFGKKYGLFHIICVKPNLHGDLTNFFSERMMLFLMTSPE